MTGAHGGPSENGFMTESSSPRPGSSPAVRHDLAATSDERRAAGKAARKRAPRGTLGVLGRGGARARRAADDPGPEPDPGARAGSPPASAHGRLGLELLPGCGRGHGRRPRVPAQQRAGGAAVRRRARAELRLVGHAGAELVVRPARLRRDSPRPIRVGRQAFCRQSCGSRAGERDQAGQGRRRGNRRRGGLSQAHAPVHGDARARHLVRRHARRQADQLLRAGRPRAGLDPH